MPSSSTAMVMPVGVLRDGDAYLAFGVLVRAVTNGVGYGLARRKHDVVALSFGHTGRSEHRLDPLVHMRELGQGCRDG